MGTINSSTWDLVDAVLDDEFAERGVDARSLSSVSDDDALEWLEALAASGLFSADELSAVSRQWRTPAVSDGVRPVASGDRFAA